MRSIVCLTLTAGLVLAALDSQGQGLKKSDSVVKVTASAGKPGADGKQVVSIQLAHEPGWHTYANPVGLDELANAATTVTFAKLKPEDVKVEYPAGKLVKDKIVGDYKVWEDKVTIKAVVQRAQGDTAPLDLAVKIQACTNKECLIPATVKLTVP